MKLAVVPGDKLNLKVEVAYLKVNPLTCPCDELSQAIVNLPIHSNNQVKFYEATADDDPLL